MTDSEKVCKLCRETFEGNGWACKSCKSLLSKEKAKRTRAKNKRKNRIQAPLSLGGEVVEESLLPFPIVHYPTKPGLFFGFAKTRESEVFLCLCSREGIQNLAESLGHSNPISYLQTLPDMGGMFQRNGFPKAIKERILLLEDLSDFDALFAESVCHMCNQVIPSLGSSHYDFADFTFARLNWYSKQLEARDGLGNTFESRKRFFESNPERFALSREKARDEEDYFKRCKSQYRQEIKMATKEKFGLQSMGGSSQSEHLILVMVRALFPDEIVQQKVRPKWLENLELDIWIPHLSIGIEYQGEQHYRPVEHWGGEEAFLALVERDKKKRKLCKANKVSLIEIKFDQALDIDSLAKMIEKNSKPSD
jgi:hypothetical protein